MSDIIFINPPYEQIAPGNDHVKHVINRSPSLGLLLLAAQARKDGYSPQIIESDLENLSAQTVADMVLEINPKFVGITLFTVGVFNASIIATLIKEKNPDITIMVGGPHISSMGYETMKKFNSFDIAALYEGEMILNKLLSSIENGDPLEDVQGIIYRDTDNSLKTTTPPPSIKELDSLPMPAWDLLPNFPKGYLPAIFDYPRAPVATYSASRGCPFKCEFCDTSTFGSKIRYNSPGKVYEIMKHLSTEYGVKHLQFVDDLFVANNAHVLRLCELLIANKIDMTWSCTARVDTVKPETLAMMKKAGCWEISFGLESGSDEMLREMKKSITAEVSARAVKWTSEAGIRVKGLFMLGYPGETKESVQTTKEFIKGLPLTTMNLSKFTPYPGSPIYKKLYGTSIREEDWDRLNGMNFVYKAEAFTQEELDKEYKEVIATFYKRVKILLHYQNMALSNPTHIKRLLLFFLGFMKTKIMQKVRA
ncbi:protein containing radical SAM domain protein/B12 binding domain [Sulfurimonas gotlandica GD1]|uniref:Protein containing radical SAM domain protein/B12 binding domain n=1 Tax=Sulfurimonas gotlandica (strain DSM 19862 / JCM 16533 / GD1) TaxID=929558 RepID=B6BHA7_SULGG|nr:radical SAM protein [Sulfurimonas gotlandica]EDZ63344.1 cobalamin B12-binding:Radical SAM [Sulfurimonas gotlandica GD1]EHP29899.1 protein containing radical SAM domain protein/B12 binding domain [Sulfurimonas gotlandica GD1]